jgi:hypothetical protein
MPEGTWGSMHAPQYNDIVPATPRPKHATVQRWMPPAMTPSAGVSPTLTSVSLAPTQDGEGWWA